ncbi:MAG: hypothetical protein E6G66_16265 [Actinobacteria bacterium]|nr:MAG: hypothetical protein E6G66_16265 [Actinomycetota bacterium]
MRTFWPAAEAAQADYEALREAALRGTPLVGPAAARFERAGLAGLIKKPLARPVFTAVVSGATRPAWTPYQDPRTEAMIDIYELLVAAAGVELNTETTATS